MGNPPFAGKNTTASANVNCYPDWLKHIHTESHGNADLVAHFFRQAFNLLREKGAFGLIATKTIRESNRPTVLLAAKTDGKSVLNPLFSWFLRV